MYKYLGTFLFISDLYSQKCTRILEHFFSFQTYIRKNVQVPWIWNISFHFKPLEIKAKIKIGLK